MKNDISYSTSKLVTHAWNNLLLHNPDNCRAPSLLSILRFVSTTPGGGHPFRNGDDDVSRTTLPTSNLDKLDANEPPSSESSLSQTFCW